MIQALLGLNLTSFKPKEKSAPTNIAGALFYSELGLDSPETWLAQCIKLLQ